MKTKQRSPLKGRCWRKKNHCLCGWSLVLGEIYWKYTFIENSQLLVLFWMNEDFAAINKITWLSIFLMTKNQFGSMSETTSLWFFKTFQISRIKLLLELPHFQLFYPHIIKRFPSCIQCSISSSKDFYQPCLSSFI